MQRLEALISYAFWFVFAVLYYFKNALKTNPKGTTQFRQIIIDGTHTGCCLQHQQKKTPLEGRPAPKLTNIHAWNVPEHFQNNSHTPPPRHGAAPGKACRTRKIGHSLRIRGHITRIHWGFHFPAFIFWQRESEGNIYQTWLSLSRFLFVYLKG